LSSRTPKSHGCSTAFARTPFRARDEQEVKGYAELLTLIYESYAEIPLSENHVKQLHKVLLGHSEKDERHRGEYKKLPNDVVRKRGEVVEEVVFKTASPFETPRLMTELVDATNAALEERSLHRLVVIGRFVVDFLAIQSIPRRQWPPRARTDDLAAIARWLRLRPRTHLSRG
jgi:hypothetical protein